MDSKDHLRLCRHFRNQALCLVCRCQDNNGRCYWRSVSVGMDSVHDVVVVGAMVAGE